MRQSVVIPLQGTSGHLTPKCPDVPRMIYGLTRGHFWGKARERLPNVPKAVFATVGDIGKKAHLSPYRNSCPLW